MFFEKNFVNDLYKTVFEFEVCLFDLVFSQAKIDVCWTVISTVNEEMVKTNKVTQIPKASDISANKSW